MPYDYRHVKDMYDQLADAGVVTQSLPDWSRHMNEVTGTDNYSAGQEDNWLKQASVAVDRALEATGAPEVTGALGEAVGGWIGDPEAGRAIGESLPRTAASMVPFFIPGVGAIAGPMSMAALGGAEAYTKTGSVASGLTSAALNLAMPGVAHVAEQAVLKGVGGKLVQGPLVDYAVDNAGVVKDVTTQAFKRYYATSLPQGIAAYTGGQAAAAGTAVASDVTQQVLSGEDVHISPTEQLLNLTLGQLPFAAMHLTKGGRVPFGGSATRAEVARVEEGIAKSKTYLQNKQLQEALDEARTKSTISDVPDYGGDVKEPTPVELAQKNFLLNKMRQQQRDLQTEGTPLSLDEWHKSVDETNRIVRETGLHEGNILGAKVDDKTERFPLIAKEVIHRPETRWRMVIAADDPRNGEYAGKKVDWSTLHEPDAQPSDVEGNLVYSVPKGYHDTKPPSPGWIDRQTRQVEGVPDLPLQPNEIVDANSELRQVEDKLRNSKSDTEFQDAVVKLNSVRQAYGWKPLDDVEIEARRQVWELGSAKDAMRNAIEETRRQVQARDAARNETELNRQRTQAQQELDAGIEKQDLTAQSIAQKKIDEIDSQMVDLSPKAIRDREDAHFATVLEQAKGGPDVNPETAAKAQAVAALYNEFAQSGKPRYNEITTGGLFQKKLLEWHQEGTGDIEQLKAKFANAIASGAGLKGRVQKAPVYEPAEGVTVKGITKPIVLSDDAQNKLNVALGSETPEDLKVFNDALIASNPDHPPINLEQAGRVADQMDQYYAEKPRSVKVKADKLAPQAEKAITAEKKAETIPVKQSIYESALKVTEGTEHADDRAKFLEMVELGKHDFQAKYKMNEDAWNDWASQDHVREWTLDLTDVVEGNMAPNSVNRPRKRTKDWVPQTPTEKDFANKIGDTGHTVLGRLLSSHDPTVAALANDLSKFQDSLKRIVVKIKDMAMGPHAVTLPDRRVQINLNSDMAKSSSSAQDADLTHELMHGLSQHELRNPLNAAHVQNLTDLRNRMINALPKDLRAQYDDISKLGADGQTWYDRYSKGKAEYKELLEATKGDGKNAQLIYGLLNNDEFLTQGFTAKPMRDYLKANKGADGQTYFHKFVNWISDLLGLKLRGTAMEEFLSHADKILDNGNYVSAIHNYGERYFANKGYGLEQARDLTTHAVGLLRDAKYNALDPEYVINKMSASLVSDTSRKAEAEVGKLLETEPESTIGLLSEGGYPPDISGATMLGTDLMLGKADPTVLDLLDPKVADHVYTRARDYASVLDMLKAATDHANEGLVNLDAADTRAPIVDTLSRLQKVLAKEQDFAMHTAQIQGLAGIPPLGYMDEVITNPAPKGLYADPEIPEKKQLSLRQRIFGTPTSLGKISKEFGELGAKGQQLLSNKHQMETTALRPLIAKIDPVTGEETFYDKGAKSLSDPMVEKAVNKWMYENQKQGKETGVVMLPSDHVDVQRILSALPEEKRQAVIDKVHGQVMSTQIAQKQTLEKMADVAVIDAAALIAPATNKPAGENVKIADAAYRAASMDFSDPAQAAQAQMLLDNVQRTVGDVGTFNDLLKFIQDQREIIKMHEERFANNPAWATAQRFGKFDLEYRRGGKPYYDKVNSRKEAEQKVAEFGGQITRFEPTAQTDDTAAAIFNNRDTPRQLARLRELEANKLEMLSKVYEPDVIEDMKRNSAVEQYAVEAAYAGGVKGVKTHERRLSKGAEEISWLQNHVNWVGQNASHWTREKFKSQARLLISDPAMKERPDLQDMGRTYVREMLSADPEIAKVANRVTSTWLMGFNFGSAIVNATQLMTRGVAEFTNITGKPLQSYKRLLSVYNEMVGAAQGKGWAGLDHEWVVKQMKDEGIMSASLFDEGAMQSEKTATNLKRALAKNRPQTLGQFLGTLAGQYSNISMMAFKGMERINNTGAVLTAFDIYREQGLSRDAAYQKALETNRTINDVGGKANRPIGLFSGTDKFSRSAAMISTSMQTYTLGTMWQLGNYLKRGGFGNSSLTAGERYNARMAAIQFLATQVGAAGTLGLPFVSQALGVLDYYFPQLQLKNNLREFITRFIGEDNENGKVLADIAMTGAPAMLGWDWHSRLSMGNILPGVSEINGAQPGLLMGAPYNVVSQFVKGAASIAQGDFAKASNLTPPGIKKFVDLAANGFQARDYNGKPIGDVTPGETIGVALGFTPKRVADYNAANRQAAQAQKVQTAQEKKFNESLVAEVEKGNFGTIQQVLNERARTDPKFDPQAAARTIAKAAVEMQFPKDLRRQYKQSNILKTFNIPASMPNEVARAQYEMQVLQHLGVPMRKRDLQMATIMDTLRAKYPEATRWELQKEAEKILKPKVQTLLPEPAT